MSTGRFWNVLSSARPKITDTTRDTGLKPFYSDTTKQTNRLEWSATSYVRAQDPENRQKSKKVKKSEKINDFAGSPIWSLPCPQVDLGMF